MDKCHFTSDSLREIVPGLAGKNQCFDSPVNAMPCLPSSSNESACCSSEIRGRSIWPSVLIGHWPVFCMDICHCVSDLFAALKLFIETHSTKAVCHEAMIQVTPTAVRVNTLRLLPCAIPFAQSLAFLKLSKTF